MKRYDFYLSPYGDDSGAGTEKEPFSTLSRARDAVREKLASGAGGEIRVGIGGGLYRFSETVVFGLEDSAPPGGAVVYEALPGEFPVFSSGAAVNSWEKAGILPPGTPESAAGNLWCADLPPGAAGARTLYGKEGLLARAAEPPFFFEQGRGAEDLFTFYFPPGAVRDDPAVREGDIEVRVIPEHPWVSNILPLACVDERGGKARTAIPATYPMQNSHKHNLFRRLGIGTAEIQNSFAGLIKPGSWVVRSGERRVYLRTRDGEEPEGISAPLLTELILIAGRTDLDGPRDEPVRGLFFRGLSFSQGDRFPWEANRTGYTLQHEWEMFDRPTALVRLRGAEGCCFSECSFRDSGGGGIRLDLHSVGNRVEHCEAARLGGAGVVLAGYGPGTKDVNRENVVSDNHIHRVGLLLWHSPGVFAWQSGFNRIEHNLIHNTPYSAIIISGRISWDKEGAGQCSRTVRWREVEESAAEAPWEVREKYLHGRGCLVAFNEIYGCMEKLGDGNAVYISGTGRDVEIRSNYIHDVDGPLINAVIRCDDDQYTAHIEDNLIENCCAEAFIWKGRTSIRNNIAAGITLESPARGGRRKRGFLVIPLCCVEGGEIGSVVENNLILASDKTAPLAGDGFTSGSGRFPGYFRRCKTGNNLYWNTCRENWALEHLCRQKASGGEVNSREAAPLLACGRGVARFGENSPAREMGIKELDLSAAGPRKKRRGPLFNEGGKK